MYPRLVLQEGRERSILAHHPWLFSRAIKIVPPNLQNGSLVAVESSNGKILGTGYYNSRSQIAVRLFTFGNAEKEIDEDFFVERLERATQLRQQFLQNFEQTTAYRLVFSESDQLPGLILDRYGDFLVLQIHTLGMDHLREPLLKALQKVFNPRGIYERSDIEVRKKDGLNTLPTGVLFGEEPPDLYEIQEHGLKFYVDMKKGQKTGFFLDQRENRFAIRSYCKGKTVLNLFGYSGGFSLSALQGGATKVTTVDISEPALQIARKNFTLNGFDPAEHEFMPADVFNYLDECLKQKRTFDVVVVDPPAFVKSKDSLNNAVNAYIKLNAKALQLVNHGGILVTSSCSSHVSQELFRTILFKAANLAGANTNRTSADHESQSITDLVILETKTQPVDHPLNISFPEGEYLKFFICLKK